MKKILSSILFGLFLTLLISFSTAKSRQEALCEKFVRVHILAESNSPYDQAVKMGVRDQVFEAFQQDFAHFTTKQEALSYLSENRVKIEHAVNRYLTDIGYGSDARVRLSQGAFPEKQYAGFLLPPGRYDALKITIGSGKGQNFFCVLFPPACVSAGISVSTAIEDVTTEQEAQVLKGEISYRFKLLELFGK